MSDDRVGWDASWVETRYVTGVVYATSKSDAAKRIRAGEGVAILSEYRGSSSPVIKGKRNPWTGRGRADG